MEIKKGEKKMQTSSSLIPPQKWPQFRVLLHAALLYSIHSLSVQRLSMTGWSGELERRQNRHVEKFEVELEAEAEEKLALAN